MAGAFNLGKVFGIQVRLHYSWFIIFLLVTASLVSPNWSQWLSWVIGIIASLLFFASVLAHELAHSLVGRANNIPIKSITLFIFGGMAQMGREVSRAGAELRMAIAGPLCSLMLGGIFGLLWWLSRDVFPSIVEIAGWLAIVNVALAIFNMIPGFPLDGGRVFRALMWHFTGNYQSSTRTAAWMGKGVAYAFIAGGIAMMFLLRNWLTGLWLVFIGWFLDNAASMSYHQARWRETMSGLTASQMMTSDYVLAPADITISQLVKEYILPRGHQTFFITEADQLKGVLTLQNIKSVPKSKWDKTRLDKIMTPLRHLKVASPEQDILSVVEQMDESEINQMPVSSEGRIVGIITRDNLLRFFRTRTELGIKGTPPSGGKNG